MRQTKKSSPSNRFFINKGVYTMSLIIREIQNTINDCENVKKTLLREADRIREERLAYQHIKHLMGVIDYEENDTVRQDSETSQDT